MTKTAALLLLAGPAALVAGVSMLSVPAAVILAGILLTVGGVMLLERGEGTRR